MAMIHVCDYLMEHCDSKAKQLKAEVSDLEPEVIGNGVRILPLDEEEE